VEQVFISLLGAFLICLLFAPRDQGLKPFRDVTAHPLAEAILTPKPQSPRLQGTET
jgi:hypothetical protein